MKVHRHYAVNRRVNGNVTKLGHGADVLSVTAKKDGIELSGRGFSHSITVKGDQVTIGRTDGTKATTIAAPKDGDPYSDPVESHMKTAHRTALGVASVLTGLPVDLLTGERSEKVYMNLGYRPELGYKKDGTRMGGRYLVRAMDRKVDGLWTMTGKDQVDFRTRNDFRQSEDETDTFTFVRIAPKPVGFSYNRPATMEMTDADNQPIHFFDGYERMSGNNFSEQVQGSVADIWREAGRPSDAVDAAKVSRYVFDAMYTTGSDGRIYDDPTTSDIGRQLVGEDSAGTWSLLQEAANSGMDREKLAEHLKKGK